MAFTGLILAGGRSTRMGEDKANLTYHGETLVQRAQQLLLRVGAANVLLSSNNHPQGLADEYPDAGPLAGIYRGLEHSEQDLLIVPVDMPLLEVALLRQLVEPSTALASYFARHPLPLYLKNTLQAKHYLQKTLTDNQCNRSIKRFLTHLQAQQLDTEQPYALANINTPTEYQQLQNTVVGIP